MHNSIFFAQGTPHILTIERDLGGIHSPQIKSVSHT